MSLVLVKKVIFIISCIGFLLLVNLMAIEFIGFIIEPNEKVSSEE